MIERKERNICERCRYYYERESGDATDPLGRLCPGADSQMVQGWCAWDTEDKQTFASRPACRRFVELEA